MSPFWKSLSKVMALSSDDDGGDVGVSASSMLINSGHFRHILKISLKSVRTQFLSYVFKNGLYASLSNKHSHACNYLPPY